MNRADQRARQEAIQQARVQPCQHRDDEAENQRVRERVQRRTVEYAPHAAWPPHGRHRHHSPHSRVHYRTKHDRRLIGRVRPVFRLDPCLSQCYLPVARLNWSVPEELDA